jgi:hypothetical protein
MPEFKLQADVSKLHGLAEDYWQKMSPREQAEEQAAFNAGEAIRNGSRSPDLLKIIVHWKSPRIVHHIEKNDPDAIRLALDIAVNHSTEVEALDALIKLQGVAIPVASAILTAIYPDRYTVIDFRALEALGYFPHDEMFYIAYLDFCRNLADAMKPQQNLPAPTKLRALDRALWQWSKKKDSKG